MLETKIGIQAPTGQKVSPSPGQQDTVGHKGPSLPTLQGWCGQWVDAWFLFCQPAKWSPPTGSPLAAGVSVLKRFPGVLTASNLSSCVPEPTQGLLGSGPCVCSPGRVSGHAEHLRCHLCMPSQGLAWSLAVVTWHSGMWRGWGKFPASAQSLRSFRLSFQA